MEQARFIVEANVEATIFMKRKEYTCPTCGYKKAVWHVRVNTSSLSLCENCLPEYSNRYSRISSFYLNGSVKNEGNIAFSEEIVQA